MILQSRGKKTIFINTSWRGNTATYGL